MNEIQSFTARIRALVAKNDLQEAIRQLQALLTNSPALDEVIVQSARFQDIRQQIRLGLVDHEQANLTHSQISLGILDLLRELETQKSAKPALQAELERAISIVNSKNVVKDSIIEAGEDIHIGDIKTAIDRQVNMSGGTYVEQQSVTHNEDNSSRYLKYIFFGFVLPGLFLFLLYWYFLLSLPFSLSVNVQEIRPTPGLPFKEGTIILRYGDKTEKLPISGEAIFKQIPASKKGEIAHLTFESNGYQTIDTTFFMSENLLLSIWRDNSLARIFGTVKDDHGSPVADAQISVQDITVVSNESGSFSLSIPFEKQRIEQRIRVFKNGFKDWDITSPIIKNEAIDIILKSK